VERRPNGEGNSAAERQRRGFYRRHGGHAPTRSMKRSSAKSSPPPLGRLSGKQIAPPRFPFVRLHAPRADLVVTRAPTGSVLKIAAGSFTHLHPSPCSEKELDLLFRPKQARSIFLSERRPGATEGRTIFRCSILGRGNSRTSAGAAGPRAPSSPVRAGFLAHHVGVGKPGHGHFWAESRIKGLGILGPLSAHHRTPLAG